MQAHVLRTCLKSPLPRSRREAVTQHPLGPEGVPHSSVTGIESLLCAQCFTCIISFTSHSKPTKRCCHPVLQKRNLRVREEFPPLEGRESGSDPALSEIIAWALSRTSSCRFQSALGEWHRQRMFKRVQRSMWERAIIQELKTQAWVWLGHNKHRVVK